MQKMKRAQGFTLIELMIVVAIIAIISAIAYPSYQDSVRKATRSDGLDTIADTAGRLERCYTTYGSYNNPSCTGVLNGATIASQRLHYNIVIASTPSTYTLTATAVSATQLKDTNCQQFVLTNTGMKTSLPAGNTCW